MNIINSNLKKTLTILIFLIFAILSSFSFYLNLPASGYFLMYLPFIMGLIFCYFLYPKYKKALKSYVDSILYFQASLVAIILVIKTVIKVPEDIFTQHLNSIHGFLYVYAMAIVAVIKCCVSYCDGYLSYMDEREQHIKEANEMNKKKEDAIKNNKISLITGVSIFTLLLLLFK
ncbi:hypothetical protein JF078_004728 [Salmonella enterica]|uniref:hypothetical protein n=1 Tax=Escherichia coli TaxID=562 RepID=UPI000BE23D46|nr:hypothetical protein [Escherichia coli]EGI8648002.1 hypothetical protein [Salmonella enterica]EFH3862529.1 hypothetical protein [Escherichia coli]EGV1258621.1 hypothetical protein [Salmonella enterica]EHE1493247.1 hypothetical protein [Salmonella enterica]PDO66794.1 hypothetical protein AWE28_20510 [Escherichia coli]